MDVLCKTRRGLKFLKSPFLNHVFSLSVFQEIFDKVNIKFMIIVSKKELKPKNILLSLKQNWYFFFFLFFFATQSYKIMLKKEQTDKRENEHLGASKASGIQPRY